MRRYFLKTVKVTRKPKIMIMNKFIRKSIWFKAFVLFLTITILNLACNQPEIMPSNTPVNAVELRNSFEFPNEYDVAGNFEYALQLVNAAGKNNSFESTNELALEFFKENEFTQTIENEVNKYSEMGFDNYIDDIVNRNIATSEFKNTILSLKSELSDFILGQNPGHDDFTTFITSKKEAIDQSTLSEQTKQLTNNFLNLALGVGNYFYKNHSTDNGTLELRDCNRMEGLLCMVLGTIVGVGVFAAVFGVLLAATVTVNGVLVTELNFFALIAVAVGVYAGIEFYDWCCSWFGNDEGNTQICDPPTGNYTKKLDCNSFRVTIFGPSEYGATQWNNTNTLPAQIITPTPVLVFSVGQPGNESEFNAQVTCVADPTDISIYTYTSLELMNVEEGEFDLLWVDTPPETLEFEGDPNGNNPIFYNIFSVSVNTPSNNDIYSYEWNVDSPHYFLSGAGSKDNSATVKCVTTGSVTTSVTVTNNCTGQIEILSAQTIITQ